MADFLIGDVKQVRELTQQMMVTKHLKAGWVLLSAATAASQEMDGLVSRYILGWLGDDEPLPDYKY